MTSNLELPPGFRFHPTDEELVMHYLCRKCASQSISVPIIAEIDLYKFDPWQLPGMALYGEKEWYFFSPRDRKYPNGSRPNRAAGSGYWKATGADKPIGRPATVGIKKALVFYSGKAPRGVKTNWIMHEYRLANVDRSATKKSSNSRLDDWVLCRIYNKKGSIEKSSIEKQFTFNQSISENFSEIEEQKPEILMSDAYMITTPTPPQPPVVSGAQPPMTTTTATTIKHYSHFDKSDSGSRIHNTTESSGSEQVMSPEFMYEKEVQSEPKWNDLERAFDYQFNYLDSFSYDPPFVQQAPQFQDDQFSTFQDMLFMQKPSYEV